MKNKLFIISFMLVFAACKKDFLDLDPQNALTETNFHNKNGVGQLLTADYHDLTGLTVHSSWWSTSGTNWMYGDITSGDAYRGGSNGDNIDGINIEEFHANPTTEYLLEKWAAVYDGVARSNTVIRAADSAIDMTDNEKKEAVAEARFLRGHFHFEAKKMWNNVPYIDENVSNFKLANDKDIWPLIEADFSYAYQNLPETQPLKGQANKWAAACYLAKCYMFEHKYTEARTLLTTIISDGKTASGDKYALNPCFQDNFDATKENSPEAVFQIQFSANDGSNGGNSNIGESTNTPATYPVSSFYTTWKQPSFNLVNSFKTDASGLPLLKTFNNENMTNDMGIESYDCSYITYQGTVDPRLDWSVGRRNIFYLDYNYGSPNPGKDWINDQNFGGPYLNIKGVYRYDQFGVYSDYYASGYLNTSAVNYNLIRFADVLLWAAECEVEVGSLEKARDYVNMVRGRARDGCYVAVDYSANDCYSYLYPSANYYVDTYNTAWTDKNLARDEVRFERRLELSMEGQRFFDLVRWGIASDYINDYLSVEKTRLNHLIGVSFVKNKNEYFPIPQREVDLSNDNGTPLLKQNPGY